jgi:cytochrome c oxidase subunit 4
MEDQEHAHPRYYLIWFILAALTAVEVAMSLYMTNVSKVVLAVGLILMAVWKAVLVAMYYMHLRYEPARLWILAISPLPFGVILVLAVITEFF